MHFYLPNFEDLVDPDYDFVTENYAPKREQEGRFLHDRFVHDFFPEPPFDGMLISKSVVRPILEQHLRRPGNLHAYYRLSDEIPVMGDCGAFSYINEYAPPYCVEEILNFYESFGFNYGVSIDHIVFASMATAERERRVEITLQNAQAFLRQHQANGYQFKPVGIVQGWDPNSRRKVIEQLVEMGYQYFAVGGMVRSTDKEICATLEAIHPVLPKEAQLHLFGVARLSIVPHLMNYGVTSADSASPIRRAFLGTGDDNYWTTDGQQYAAIRVPEAKKDNPRKRGVVSTEEVLQNNGVDLVTLQQMERRVLDLLRAYDRGEAKLEETLDVALRYDRLHGDKRNHEAAYRRTLADRPWQKCGCPICEKIRIEVIIFRGNNRNRRRGFHNAKVFYEQFRSEVARQNQLRNGARQASF